ncbi:MAG: arylsulfatase [Planctomycetes bacterium]|nr:arylsulfatase [Planctomycetota bacterium]
MWKAFVLATVVLSSSVAAAAEYRPNILLLLADDVGYSDLGCYGGEIHTPHLDALAAHGLRFTQFYNCARCCPSRASLLTGLYPHQAGMGEMDNDSGAQFPGYRGRLNDRCVTIPEVLRTAGYRTYMVGKWHLGPNPGPIRRGFDEFYGMIGGFNSCWQEHPFYTRLPPSRTPRSYPPGQFYSTDVFADYALDFLAAARKDRGRPWFLYLAFNAAHFPLHAPNEEIAKYEKLYASGWDKVREGRLGRMQKLGLLSRDTPLTPRSLVPANPFNVQTGWADRDNPAWDSLPADRRADLARRMAVYAGMVDRMDQAIGRVIADLKDHGELDNTLVIFLSDNGACAEWDPWGFDGASGPHNVLHGGDDLKKVGGPESYVSYGSGWANACNTPFRLYKHYVHEGGISTPLIIHWPAVIKSRGEFRSQPGHVIDLMATCVEVSKARYPARAKGQAIQPMEGRSLVPAFAHQPLDRDFLAWEHEGNRAIRAGSWKLVARAGQPWQLYDLDRDRVELQNLAGRYPDRVKELAAKWEAWARRTQVLPKPGPGE